MIQKIKALEIANNHVGSQRNDYIVLKESTLEKPYGWIFFYNSKEFIETGNLSFALAGNAPFLVLRESGDIIKFGTAHSIEYYIKEFENGLI